MTWRRGKGEPLTRNEVEQLNEPLQGLSLNGRSYKMLTVLDEYTRQAS